MALEKNWFYFILSQFQFFKKCEHHLQWMDDKIFSALKTALVKIFKGMIQVLKWEYGMAVTKQARKHLQGLTRLHPFVWSDKAYH